MSEFLYFEDFAAGQIYDLGSHTINAAEIVEFAQEFDPQPQHLDPIAAKDSILGGLAASGWYLCALAMRKLVDGLLVRAASQGAPGVEQVQWRRPVLAGDVLTMSLEVLNTRASAKGTRGFVHARFEMRRGAERVMMFESPLIIGRRIG